VSGIGFIGGGLIFVRGDIVRGSTTAAIVWMTAAIGIGLWLRARAAGTVVTAPLRDRQQRQEPEGLPAIDIRPCSSGR
jgi:uncharacterized membrane protein YhiD involved in acid resistance